MAIGQASLCEILEMLRRFAQQLRAVVQNALVQKSQGHSSRSSSMSLKFLSGLGLVVLGKPKKFDIDRSRAMGEKLLQRKERKKAPVTLPQIGKKWLAT